MRLFAKSTYDLELIEKRIAELRSRETQDDETRREIEYLEDLKRRKFPSASAAR